LHWLSAIDNMGDQFDAAFTFAGPDFVSVRIDGQWLAQAIG